MLIAALAGLSGVALTQSRGGILGLAAGLAVIGFVVLTRRNKVFLTAALPAIAVIAALMIVVAAAAEPWEVFKSPTTPSNWANQERASHWSAGFDMINESPLLGVGAGGFGDRYRISTNHWRFRISQGHAHNAYLQVAAEAGLGAMVAYLSLIAAIVGSVIRRARSSSDPWFEIGVLAVTFALLTHQLVDYLHALSLGLLFAGLWAAALESGSRGPTVRERDTVA
jgi:O-antigen ligase